MILVFKVKLLLKLLMSYIKLTYNDKTLYIKLYDNKIPDLFIENYKPKEILDIKISNNVKKIGFGSLSGCTQITSLDIPKSVNKFGNYAFSKCINLKNINIPQSKNLIEYCIFSGCESLTTINIPNQIHTIEDGAFQFCFGLKILYIPDSVTMIKRYAFYKCLNLSTLIISNSIKSISKDAFRGCVSLKTVIFKGYNSELVSFFNQYCPNVNKIWAPDSMIPKLNGKFSSYNSWKDIPNEMKVIKNNKASKNIDLWLWWATYPKLNDSRLFCNDRKKYTLTLLLIALKLEKINLFPETPQEIWLMILGFIKHQHIPEII